MTDISGLRRHVLSLTSANILDYVLQFFLPILLVRFLDKQAFADYRLAWLVIGTVMAIAPFYMPRSLFYFLPRASGKSGNTYINQCLLFLLATGVISALVVSRLNPWLPEQVRNIEGGIWFLPAFLLVWVGGSMIELLPNAEQRTVLQAKLIALLALSRVVLVGTAALTGKVEAVFFGLLLYGAAKLLLGIVYIGLNHGWRMWQAERRSWLEQLHYILPYGVSSAIFALRGQTDQWVAASLFQPSDFAAYSIAAIVAVGVSLIRTSVNNAVTPRINALHGNDDIPGMTRLNQSINAAIAYILLLYLGLVFVVADPLVDVVYTHAYAAAANVMRVNVIALVGVTVEVSTMMYAFNQGRYLLAVECINILIGVTASYLGAQYFGLSGAALGGVVMLWLGNAASFWRVSRLTSVELQKLQAWRSVFQALGSTVVAVVVAMLLGNLLPDLLPPWRLALLATLYGSTYCVAVQLFGGWSAVREVFGVRAGRGQQL